MSLWTRITEALTALAKGEGLSAVFDKLRAPPERTVAFTIAVIALSAKMAKADGQVTRDEVTAFRQVFHIPPAEERAAARVFDLAREDVAGFEDYAARIARMFRGRGRDGVLSDLLGGLFHIATADGAYHPAEDAFLARVAGIFGLSEAEFRTLRAAHVAGVALFDLCQNGFKWLGCGIAAQFQPSAMGANVGACSDVKLDLGLGANDRANVAPIQHSAPFAAGKAALEGQECCAHFGDDGHLAGGLPSFQSAQIIARQILGCQGLRRQNRVTAFDPNGAVKRPGVQMGKAEPIRHRATDRAFARRCWPVDCHGKSHATSSSRGPRARRVTRAGSRHQARSSTIRKWGKR